LALEIFSDTNLEFTGQIFDAFGKQGSNSMPSSVGQVNLFTHALPEGVFSSGLSRGSLAVGGNLL
jgi:hypothetical protein